MQQKSQFYPWSSKSDFRFQFQLPTVKLFLYLSVNNS